MSSDCVFGIRAFDSYLRVECDNVRLRNMLHRYILPPLPRCDASCVAPDISIQAMQSPDSFQILVDGQRVASAITIDDAVLEVVKAVDDALIKRFKSLRAVHAGAIVLRDKALIIPGTSHAGKSSLVAELLRRGATHLSDEYALIDSLGRIHAYPRPLLLRNGSPKQSPMLPEELTSSFATGPVSVAWIFAIEYSPGAEWEIRRLSQGEAVMLLLRNTPHEMEHTPGMVDSFLALAANAECYQGKRGEAGKAADQILSLVTR